MVPASQTTSLGVVLRGMLMGLAEVVPGVSGGTMAFITGIYQELVATLATFGPRSVTLLIKPRAFYEAHNLRFLTALGLGMGAGILMFAQVMHYLLNAYQPLVWAFFSGVIVMSAWVIGRPREVKSLLAFTPLGVLLGLSLLWLPTSTTQPGLIELFFGGAVAVCAWLLPAISGSYVLLTLGLYNAVIDALANFDLPVLASLAAGCGVGLLVFARLLSWLLHHYSEHLLSLLIGFMLGSLPKLWPWQDLAQSGVLAKLLLPAQYGAGPAYLGGTLITFAAGVVLLWLLTRLTDHK